MCPFDQLHAILKDYIMLLHNRQRKKMKLEKVVGEMIKREKMDTVSEVKKKIYIVHHQKRVQV